MSHKKVFKCLYPGCLVSPREKRTAVLHFIRSHLQPKEAPFYCKVCEIGLADVKHVEEHTNLKRHQKKQQKNVGTDCSPRATGRSLDVSSWVVEVKKPEVDTDDLWRKLNSMPKEAQEALFKRLSSGGDIVREAILQAFGTEFPEMEVELVEVEKTNVNSEEEENAEESIVIDDSSSGEKESDEVEDSDNDDEDPQEKVLILAAQLAEENSPQKSAEELQNELIEMAASASQEMKEQKEVDLQEEMLILAAKAAEESEVNESDVVSIQVDDSEFVEEDVEKPVEKKQKTKKIEEKKERNSGELKEVKLLAEKKVEKKEKKKEEVDKSVKKKKVEKKEDTEEKKGERKRKEREDQECSEKKRCRCYEVMKEELKGMMSQLKKDILDEIQKQKSPVKATTTAATVPYRMIPLEPKYPLPDPRRVGRYAWNNPRYRRPMGRENEVSRRDVGEARVRSVVYKR